MTDSQNKTAEIARLNDQARTDWINGGAKVIITQGIQAFGETDQQKIFKQVIEFNDFSEDNNPYGERDFGSFTFQEQKLFWKIDYYNKTLDGGSSNPSDPEATQRVLTILLASEY